MFLAYWDDCRSALDPSIAASFTTTASTCESALNTESLISAGVSLAEELGVVCADGTPSDDCIPECTAALYGISMILNLDGNDSKFSCEQHHGIHSWMGPSADGGYLGKDIEAFFAAVNSGAAGRYMGVMLTDGGFDADLLIVGEDQKVSVSGADGQARAPRWALCDDGDNTCTHANDGVCDEQGKHPLCQSGTDSADCGGALCTGGSFLVQERGQLSLARVDLIGVESLTMEDGAVVELNTMNVPQQVLLSVFNSAASAVGAARVRLTDITVVEDPAAGPMTGTLRVGAHGARTLDPPDFVSFGSPSFSVNATGPCAAMVSDGGLCITHPPDDSCTEAFVYVVGGVGQLECTPGQDPGTDVLTFRRSGGQTYAAGQACPPAGTSTLIAGDVIKWEAGASMPSAPRWQLCFPAAPAAGGAGGGGH